jgi:hypothetical protein
MVQRYPNGRGQAEDTNQRVTYGYDTNGVNPGFSQYSQGRLATAQYTVGALGADHTMPVTEMYSYHAAGAVTAKRMQVVKCGTDPNGDYGCGPGYVEADYTYNANGQMASYGTSLTQWGYPGCCSQPNSQVVVAGPVYTYTYDSMARPVSLRDNTDAYNG